MTGVFWRDIGVIVVVINPLPEHVLGKNEVVGSAVQPLPGLESNSQYNVDHGRHLAMRGALFEATLWRSDNLLPVRLARRGCSSEQEVSPMLRRALIWAHRHMGFV